MKTEIEYSSDLPEVQEYAALFETTGWNDNANKTPQELHRAASASWRFVSARIDGRLAGIGRVISDGVAHAFVVDFVIAPEYQGRSIGTAILQRLVGAALDKGIRDIQLFAAKGKGGFT